MSRRPSLIGCWPDPAPRPAHGPWIAVLPLVLVCLLIAGCASSRSSAKAVQEYSYRITNSLASVEGVRAATIQVLRQSGYTLTTNPGEPGLIAEKPASRSQQLLYGDWLDSEAIKIRAAIHFHPSESGSVLILWIPRLVRHDLRMNTLEDVPMTHVRSGPFPEIFKSVQEQVNSLSKPGLFPKP